MPNLNYKKHKKKRSNLYILLVVLAVIALMKLALPGVYGGVAHAVGLPFAKAGLWANENFSGFFDYIERQKKLVAENRDLKTRLEDLERKELYAEVVKYENSALKELLGREVSEGGALARIIVAPPRAAYDTIIIDLGTSDGVKNGDFVIASNNTGLGRVEEAYLHSSKVSLYSTSNETTDAVIARSDLPVKLHGRGGGNFIAEVPRDADVSNGDIALLSHEDNYILSTVQANELDNTGSFRILFLKSPININETRWVFVQDNQAIAISKDEDGTEEE